MSDEKLTPERAVRLLRAKAAELEGHARGNVAIPTQFLAADIALVAQLLADHIERQTGQEWHGSLSGRTYTEAPNVKVQGYLASILEVTEFDVGSPEEADYVAALKAECDAYLGKRVPPWRS